MRTYFRETALIVAGTLAGLALMELGLRAFFRTRVDSLTAGNIYLDAGTCRMCRYSDRYGYELIPNAQDGVNTLGMHDRERSIVKKRGVFRLMVLGDSITEYGRWTKYLEALLNRHGSYEVMNCAVRGWGLYQYHAYALRNVATLKPDLVLLALCLNDVESADVVHTILADKGTGKVKSYFLKGSWKDGNRTLTISYNRYLFEHSYAYRLIFSRFFFARSLDQALARSHEPAVRKLREIRNKTNGHVLAVIFPYLKPLGTYSGYERREYESTKSFLAEAGIESIDLTPDFNAYQQGIVAFRDDPIDQIHFNDRANRMKAELLHQRISLYLRRSRTHLTGT
ncbi:MAG: SGNH/GDSL hydrolase family protein [Elusimicrobia bacterium]|nr:SGNH/GDSL hydrolase family protein [Elusimicrobiota bacterium]